MVRKYSRVYGMVRKYCRVYGMVRKYCIVNGMVRKYYRVYGMVRKYCRIYGMVRKYWGAVTPPTIPGKSFNSSVVAAVYVHCALSVDFSLDFCYTFVLQKSGDVLCCCKTTRHFKTEFTRFSNLRSCLHKRFFPLQQQPARQYKSAQSFMLTGSSIEVEQLHLKLYQSMSVSIMEVNDKRRRERITLRMLVRRLILKMQVDLQWEQDQTKGLDNEEFSAFMLTKAIK